MCQTYIESATVLKRKKEKKEKEIFGRTSKKGTSKKMEGKR